MKDTKKTKTERLIASFGMIEEATFWPRDIQIVRDVVSKDITFKELNDYLNSDFITRMNEMNNRERDFEHRYTKTIEELQKMRNQFSEDIDFI